MTPLNSFTFVDDEEEEEEEEDDDDDDEVEEKTLSILRIFNNPLFPPILIQP